MDFETFDTYVLVFSHCCALSDFYICFRDASFGNCTYSLTVLDCLHGISKVRNLNINVIMSYIETQSKHSRHSVGSWQQWKTGIFPRGVYVLWVYFCKCHVCCMNDVDWVQESRFDQKCGHGAFLKNHTQRIWTSSNVYRLVFCKSMQYVRVCVGEWNAL